MAKSSFSLDDIRAAAEKKYGATEIAGAELRNPIRLSDDERKALAAAYDKLDVDEDSEDAENLTKDDIFNALAEILVVLATHKTKDKAKALVDSLDGQIDLAQEVLAHWNEDQKADPKAGPSQD